MVDTDRAGGTVDHDDGLAGDEAPREVRLTPEERAARLAEGAPRVPRRVVVWGLVAAAVLALGGTLAERLVSAAGLNPATSPSVTTTTGLPIVKGGPTAGSALLPFTPLRAVAAPNVVLTDQHGRAVSLAGFRGKVVVLTFFDASCADACPVVASELRHAAADLGPLRSQVVFLTVNTDPLALAASSAPSAATRTGLAALSSWHFLTGSIHALNKVWSDFGVTISVYVDQKVVVHNDVLYLVDRHGDLVSRGSPFSDENRRGVFSLPASLEGVAGRGLATAVTALVRARRVSPDALGGDAAARAALRRPGTSGAACSSARASSSWPRSPSSPTCRRPSRTRRTSPRRTPSCGR